MNKADCARMSAITQMMQGTLKVKTRKKRAKETKPREQPERELRNNVIKALRKIGCHVYRIENAITGRNNTGISDLLVFRPSQGICLFIELKSVTGPLQSNQRVFQGLCDTCGIRYRVVRSVDEAVEVVCS